MTLDCSDIEIFPLCTKIRVILEANEIWKMPQLKVL